MQWEYEKWKFMSGNQLLLFSALTEAALRVRTDGAADCDADHTDPHGASSQTPTNPQQVMLKMKGVTFPSSTVQDTRFASEHLDVAELLQQIFVLVACQMVYMFFYNQQVLSKAEQTLLTLLCFDSCFTEICRFCKFFGSS